jgi:hypothetical protein
MLCWIVTVCRSPSRINGVAYQFDLSTYCKLQLIADIQCSTLSHVAAVAAAATAHSCAFLLWQQQHCSLSAALPGRCTC